MLPIQDVYAMPAADDERSQLIVEDVVVAAQAKRAPVVLTERREHLLLPTGTNCGFSRPKRLSL